MSAVERDSRAPESAEGSAGEGRTAAFLERLRQRYQVAYGQALAPLGQLNEVLARRAVPEFRRAAVEGRRHEMAPVDASVGSHERGS